MKIHTLLFLIGTTLGAIAPSMASAQTCRIASGVNSEGYMTFKEVYEFDYVEEKPKFPGGGAALLNYINETRRYPAEAYSKGVEGRVTCAFVINADGKVSHVSVLRGVEPSLNKEAMRIFSKMPALVPGKIEGRAVPVRVICAVPFRK